MLLDDELPGLTYLKMLCEQLPDLEVVKAFNDPVVFLEKVHSLDFDFCILDIEMPGINGLQLINLLAGKPVVFATAYKEYAAEAYDLNALDYIRKPIQMERLKQAIEKVKRYVKTQEKEKSKFFQINTNKGKTILFFDKIAYIKTAEYDSRDKLVILFNGDEFILKNITFKYLLKILPHDNFCQANKAEIVALKAVHVFSFDEITTNLRTETGKIIRISLNEKYRKAFLQKIEI